MSRRDRRRSKGKLPPFIAVTKSIYELEVWRTMSMGSRWLYVDLKKYWRKETNNNGHLYRAHRDAAKSLGTKSTRSVARWFRELEFYGFIVKTTEGCLGSDGEGVSPHYRLTELPYGNQAATCDYEKWARTRFVDDPVRKHGRRPGEKNQNKKQNPDSLGDSVRLPRGLILATRNGLKTP